MNKFLLIDGNALMHRAYHAIPYLTTSSGEKVNAIFGFTSLFLRSLNDLQPECVIFTFDRPTPTFRHEMYADYKATRQKMEEDLANQIPRLKQVVEAFGFPVYELDGFEADDLIGTVSRQVCESSPEDEVYIMTADMDATQLVNERVHIYTAKQKISEVIIYDVQGVIQKYNGLQPSQIVDYKALRGDSSDNIPGVPGIGEKTATDLLLKYETLDNIYANLGELKDRTINLLESGKESAYLSKKLATIDTHAPIMINVEECRVHRLNRELIIQLFQELEFRSLINKLPVNGAASPALSQKPQQKAEIHYTLIQNREELKTLVSNIKQQKQVAFDTETTGLNIWESRLLGISCSWEKGHAYYIPYSDDDVDLHRDWLEDNKIAKIAHNAKFDSETLSKAGIKVSNLSFDTMLAAYLLKEGTGRYGLKELAFTELGITATTLEELTGTNGKSIDVTSIPLDQLSEYAAADADVTWQLYQLYSDQFSANPSLGKLFNDIELPVSEVLASMEEAGILLNSDLLAEMSEEISVKLQELEQNIYADAGHEFNINSPKQLGDVLFDELHLPSNKKTKTGRSTNEAVLQELKGLHPIIDHIFQYRELFKLKSTYIDALPLLVSKYDGRVHTSYNQAVAATGRLSSSNPNLQNIPIKTEIGRKIRQAFIADPGHKLLSVDYSQIELRLLAHMAQDQNLLQAFKAGQDIHSATAAKVFNCEIDQVTSSQRRAAKTINFGIMYGQSAFSLSKQLGISRDEASKFIHEYFNAYSSVKKFIDQSIKQAHEQGYVETLFGRRRRVPELSSSNFQVRQAAERMAFNMPIQGTAADIIKKAMIKIHEYLEQHHLKSKMLLQVHDELVFTIDPSEESQIIPVIQQCMRQAADLSVELEVEAKIGPNWGEMEKI